MRPYFNSADIGIDLGTSKFSICVRGEGLVISEPAAIAYRGPQCRRETVVAVGTEAAAMEGRSPADLSVVRPMRNGIIERPEMAALLLQTLARRAGIMGYLSRRRHLIVGSILGASALERRIFIEVAESLGVGKIKTVPEPLAAAVGSWLPLDEAQGRMLLDVGSGASELIIFARGRIIQGRSIRVGGAMMDQAIIDAVQKRYEIVLSQQTARLAKEALSTPFGTDPIPLQGFDRRRMRPCRFSLSRDFIEAAIAKPIALIVAMVVEVLATLDPDCAVDLIENGLSLGGGGAFTCGLKAELERATRLDVTIVREPSQAVAYGCQAMLEHFALVHAPIS